MFCECEDILVRFGRAVALNVPHLAIPAGRITAVVGPNGAGKTTLLEVMALLRRPHRGRVKLWGRLARPGERALRRRAVMVMHPGYLFRGSVWSNVTYGLRARGVGRREAAARAADALREVGLPDLAHRKAAELSSGERQRVNLARAIAIAPEAILLDEPTANVDSRTVADICALLRRLRDEHGTTIVYASPAENGIEVITDRLIELAGGRVRSETSCRPRS
ncbi:MAG: hypothetical protein AMS14_07495 [Planctomycetes bacterium DG_20]|nr:MAG: hypothetical protein AMS14_07495 [Planctomycetes bacterium DG_20]